MRTRQRWYWREGRERALVLILVTALASLQVVGCLECLIFADPIDHRSLRGIVLDADAFEGLSGAAVGGRTFTNGEVTAVTSALKLDGTPNVQLTGEDGAFGVGFVVGGAPACQTPLGPRLPPPEFPRPDQIEVTVARDGCEQTFLIDVNEDTVVDLDFPDDVIELKDPILVPPCEE